MRLRLVAASFLFAASLVPTATAFAEEMIAQVDSATATSVSIAIRNQYEYPVKVIGVRLGFEQDDGTTQYHFTTGPWSTDLQPGQEWTGTLNLVAAEGVDFSRYDTISVAAGVDINAAVAPAEAAIAAGDVTAMEAQLSIVDGFIPPVSRSARFHAEQIAASGVEPTAWFDLERLDATKTRLEDAICLNASTRILEAGGDARRLEVYNELASHLREIGLHITCINREAKLSAAQMLLAGERPQDALIFKETDENGVLLPEWRPIYITANLALATAAADLQVQVLSSIRPAVEALNEVRALEPDNAELAVAAARVVPMAAAYIRDRSGAMNRNLDEARGLLELLRPHYDHIPGVREAAGVFAGALIESGVAFCERREFINARNEFLRGERVLDGIAEWEAEADQINRCRALGALAEGVELANHPTDPDAPATGYAKLEEAQERYDLTEQEINDFKAAIATAWVSVATRFLEEYAFTGADNALVQAETVSPTGMTDAMRDAWISYAEKRFERGGYLMSGTDVQDARRALGKVGDYGADRVGAISGKLTMAYYGYRVALPASVVLFGVLAALYAWVSKQRAKRLGAMADLD